MNIEFAPRDIVRVVFRHRVKVVATFSACVLVSVAYLTVATPKYGISSSILVTTDRNVPVSVGAQDASHENLDNQDRHDIINSHIKIIQGRDLAFQVLNDIGIEKVYPEVAAHPPSVGTAMDEAVKRFSDDLYVTSPRDTNLIEVSLLNPDPKIGVIVEGDLISRFLEKQGRAFSNPQSDFLKEQLTTSREQLAQAQTELENFRLTTHISSIDDERLQLIHQRYDLEAQARQADAHIAETAQRAAALNKSLHTSLPATVQLYSDNDLRYRSQDDATTRLVDLRLKENELLKNYQESSEPVQRIKAEIALVDKTVDGLSQQKSSRSGLNQVHQDISTDLVRAQGELAATKALQARLATEINAVVGQLEELDKRQATFKDLQRQYEIADQNYRNYARSIEEARITDDLNKERITGVSVIEPATASVRPERPRRALTLLLGIVLGFIISLLTAILSETYDQRISTPHQAEGALNLPVLMSFGYQSAQESARGFRPAS